MDICNGFKRDSEIVSYIEINDYPGIKEYFDGYEPKLSARSDKDVTQYNMRNCAYLDIFNEEKLIYPEISAGANFYYDKMSYYIEMTVFVITGEKLNIYWLC